ncbi:MAG TPA: BON domain-containing protein, partial [Bryobacteraceae bacterium]|nr:BON domain-containing protein [Bryobacteraceae bacterium]
GGNRLFFDLTVQPNETRLDAVRREMAMELGNQNVSMDVEGQNVFLRGSVPNLTEAQRAVEIASTVGRPVNLLRVNIPKTDLQILLKVRFADVDRSALQQLGLNWFRAQGNTAAATNTGEFSPPTVNTTATTTGRGSSTSTLTDALNVFLFRSDLNLGVAIQALEGTNRLQILAEPNVLAINGHPASFLAGGEFPYPTLQGGGAGLGAVTIQYREFGVRLNFTPQITPRGTIRLAVTPEVSSLDFANGFNFQGTTIPALSTRRVQTEIELEDGQSFAIGGLLDNRTTETFDKIPGLGDIPFFGKLFRSRETNKNNTELLVLVTPEIVRPIPKGTPLPELKFPDKFLPPNTSSTPPKTPGVDVTGPAGPPPTKTIPVEELTKSEQGPAAQQPAPAIQFVPVPLVPTTAPAAAPAPPPSVQLPASK